MTLKEFKIVFLIEKEEVQFPYWDQEGELHEWGKIKNKDFLKRGSIDVADEYGNVELLQVWVNLDGSIVINYENERDKEKVNIQITGDSFKAVTSNTNEYRENFYPSSRLGRIEDLLNLMF